MAMLERKTSQPTEGWQLEGAGGLRSWFTPFTDQELSKHAALATCGGAAKGGASSQVREETLSHSHFGQGRSPGLCTISLS